PHSERRCPGDARQQCRFWRFGGYGPFLEMDPDLAERQINLHLTALVRLTRAAVPGMVAPKSGARINASSMLAFKAGISLDRPKRATYAASKAYIKPSHRYLPASWRALASSYRHSARAWSEPSSMTRWADAHRACP